MKNRSDGSVVRSALSIKQWIQKPPTVDEARPSACPRCDAPSRPFGGAIQLHGHGVRERQVRGPGAPDEPEVAGGIEVKGRRYRCVLCHAVVLVVPSEVLPGRHYSASAIGLVLALWGLLQATARAVRARGSSAKELGFDAMRGWAAMRRWAKAVKEGGLFAWVPRAGPSATLREVAAIAAAALAASADPASRHLPIEQRAFFGAAHAA